MMLYLSQCACVLNALTFRNKNLLPKTRWTTTCICCWLSSSPGTFISTLKNSSPLKSGPVLEKAHSLANLEFPCHNFFQHRCSTDFGSDKFPSTCRRRLSKSMWICEYIIVSGVMMTNSRPVEISECAGNIACFSLRYSARCNSVRCIIGFKQTLETHCWRGSNMKQYLSHDTI